METRKKYFLTEDQTKKLLELGVDPEYPHFDLIGTKSYFYTDTSQGDQEIMGAIPILSATDLLELLPAEIGEYRFCLYKDAKNYYISYLSPAGETLFSASDPLLPGVTYTVLLWWMEKKNQKKP